AHLPELFNLFHRTFQARAGAVPGFGLGFYICKALVEVYGGRIWIDSTSGATTTVAFTLLLVLGGRQRSICGIRRVESRVLLASSEQISSTLATRKSLLCGTPGLAGLTKLRVCCRPRPHLVGANAIERSFFVL